MWLYRCETVVRAREDQLPADLSDVALLKRLRKSKDWLFQLCRALFAERGLGSPAPGQRLLRPIDATVVQEPGKTGGSVASIIVSNGRHWSAIASRSPLAKEKAPVKRSGIIPSEPENTFSPTGVTASQIGIRFPLTVGLFDSFRLNPHSIRLEKEDGSDFELLARLESIQKTGQLGVWKVGSAPGSSRASRTVVCH